MFGFILGVTLYLVDEAAGEIYQFQKSNTNDRHKVNWKIEEGKTVAAYVAFCKEFIMVDDILGDDRFLDGIGHKGDTILILKTFIKRISLIHLKYSFQMKL